MTDPQAAALIKSIHVQVKAAHGSDSKRMHLELQKTKTATEQPSSNLLKIQQHDEKKQAIHSKKKINPAKGRHPANKEAHHQLNRHK
jgi:hypothetical protein